MRQWSKRVRSRSGPSSTLLLSVPTGMVLGTALMAASTPACEWGSILAAGEGILSDGSTVERESLSVSERKAVALELVSGGGSASSDDAGVVTWVASTAGALGVGGGALAATASLLALGSCAVPCRAPPQAAAKSHV